METYFKSRRVDVFSMVNAPIMDKSRIISKYFLNFSNI